MSPCRECDRSASRCGPTSPNVQIETLDDLYAELGALSQDIDKDCPDCTDPDCMGYIWLLPSEVERLLGCGVSLIQLNDDTVYLPWGPRDENGIPDIDQRYPKCELLSTSERRCTIHGHRPFVCRLYPVGLETKADGTIVWATHLDCLYVRRLGERGELPLFEERVRSVIKRISPSLMKEIMDTYRAVDKIFFFPDGENRYKELEVQNV